MLIHLKVRIFGTYQNIKKFQNQCMAQKSSIFSTNKNRVDILIIFIISNS